MQHSHPSSGKQKPLPFAPCLAASPDVNCEQNPDSLTIPLRKRSSSATSYSNRSSGDDDDTFDYAGFLQQLHPDEAINKYPYTECEEDEEQLEDPSMVDVTDEPAQVATAAPASASSHSRTREQSASPVEDSYMDEDLRAEDAKFTNGANPQREAFLRESDSVNTTTSSYRQCYSTIQAQFPHWLREVALQGEIPLPSIRTAEERHALARVARDYHYTPTRSRESSCILVRLPGTHQVYLRSGNRNPYLPEELIKNLSRLESEYRRRAKESPSVQAAPFVLRWCFNCRFQYIDVVEVLRGLAYEIGVFRGVLAPSHEGRPASAPPLSPIYLFPIEVSLDYLPAWREELQRLLSDDAALQEDPYPVPSRMIHNAQSYQQYRQSIRPFLFNWNPAVTSCCIEGISGDQASGTCTLYSLRREEGNNCVYYHRWPRYLLETFLRFTKQAHHEDRELVEKTLKELRAAAGKGSPVSEEQLLIQAKNATPHFGTVYLTLESNSLQSHLAELRDFATRSRYYVYARRSESHVFIAATGRDLPVLDTKVFELLFLPNGEYVGTAPGLSAPIPDPSSSRALPASTMNFTSTDGRHHRSSDPCQKRSRSPSEKSSSLPPAARRSKLERSTVQAPEPQQRQKSSKAIEAPTSKAAQDLYERIVGKHNANLRAAGYTTEMQSVLWKPAPSRTMWVQPSPVMVQFTLNHLKRIAFAGSPPNQ